MFSSATSEVIVFDYCCYVDDVIMCGGVVGDVIAM